MDLLKILKHFQRTCERPDPAFWSFETTRNLDDFPSIFPRFFDGFRSFWVISGRRICTFANNQHRVDLGSHWKKSPFYRGMCGLKATGGSVLMAMDSVASTLTRTG